MISGRSVRILSVVDDITRECLALVVDTSLSGARVARELDAVVAVRGVPLMIVSDNGTELTSLAISAALVMIDTRPPKNLRLMAFLTDATMYLATSVWR